MNAECRNLSASDVECDQQSIASLVSAVVVLRAGAVALILGSVLTFTNQSGVIIGEDSLLILPLLLVYLTPFVVATISQVLGIRKALLDARQSQPSDLSQDAFMITVISHGIPLNSLLLGLIIGTVNTLIVVLAAIMDTASTAAVPAALIGQAFILPMLCGLISQAISYRRASSAVGQPALSGACSASA